VLEAEDAEKGLEIAYRDNPAIIFLDIVLPGMSGFTALRHLRQDPRTKNIPIIMISGNEQATEQFYVQRIGADDFMKKPFSRAELFTRIQKLLDKNLVPVRFNEYVHATETAVEEDNAEQIAENENEAEKSN
jgi:twitching motility two-component system response regulator PilH